jgi:ribosomal protein L32
MTIRTKTPKGAMPVFGYDGKYLVDSKCTVYVRRHTSDFKIGYEVLHPHVLNGQKYFVFKAKGKQKRVYYDELFRKIRKDNQVRIIKRGEFEGRMPFTRARVIDFLLKHNPEVHIPMTQLKDGNYHISEDMKAMGMVVCHDCGHIQATEIRVCKNCNTYITN